MSRCKRVKYCTGLYRLKELLLAALLLGRRRYQSNALGGRLVRLGNGHAFLGHFLLCTVRRAQGRRPGKRAYEPGVWCMTWPYLARLEGQLVLADVVGSQVNLGSVAPQHGGNRRKRRRLNAGSPCWSFFYTVSTAQASRRGSTPCAAPRPVGPLLPRCFRELCRLRLLPAFFSRFFSVVVSVVLSVVLVVLSSTSSQWFSRQNDLILGFGPYFLTSPDR